MNANQKIIETVGYAYTKDALCISLFEVSSSLSNLVESTTSSTSKCIVPDANIFHSGLNCCTQYITTSMLISSGESDSSFKKDVDRLPKTTNENSCANYNYIRSSIGNRNGILSSYKRKQHTKYDCCLRLMSSNVNEEKYKDKRSIKRISVSKGIKFSSYEKKEARKFKRNIAYFFLYESRTALLDNVSDYCSEQYHRINNNPAIDTNKLCNMNSKIINNMLLNRDEYFINNEKMLSKTTVNQIKPLIILDSNVSERNEKINNGTKCLNSDLNDNKIEIHHKILEKYNYEHDNFYNILKNGEHMVSSIDKEFFMCTKHSAYLNHNNEIEYNNNKSIECMDNVTDDHNLDLLRRDENYWGSNEKIFMHDKLSMSNKIIQVIHLLSRNVLSFLLIFVPFGFYSYWRKWGDIYTFLFNVLGIIPLSWLIGKSTEDLAVSTGHVFGGLLNATFGNVVELLLCIAGLRQVFLIHSSSYFLRLSSS